MYSSQLLHWLMVWLWIIYFFLGPSSPICQRKSGTQWSPESLSVLSFWFQVPHDDRVKLVLYLVDQEQIYFFPLRYSNISYFLINSSLHWDYSLYGTCNDFSSKKSLFSDCLPHVRFFAGCSRATKTMRHTSCPSAAYRLDNNTHNSYTSRIVYILYVCVCGVLVGVGSIWRIINFECGELPLWENIAFQFKVVI